MRRSVQSIALAFAALLAASASARASTISIGTGQTYATLADGYAAASNGDTLLIYNGIYAGGLTVNKLLTFQAVNVGGAIIEGTGGADAVFTVAKNSTFIGLTLRNAARGYYQRDNNAHGIIENSLIYGVTEGVEINDSGGTAGSFDVFQSTISGFVHALQINDGGTINITNSIIANGDIAYLASDFIAINPDHNLLFNVATVATNILAGHAGIISTDLAQIIGDPLFVNATGFDFRLAAGSSAIDSGKDIGFAFEGLAPDRGAFEVTAVPEPSSLALCGLGSLAGLSGCWRAAWLRRRRPLRLPAK